LGFHDAFQPDAVKHPDDVQTFSWVNWSDQGLFKHNFTDAVALSHEIAEWINDPFGDNMTPPWQQPGAPGSCQNNLETGDPIEGLPTAPYPVSLHGYTYHPQNEALLQWFTRESPSSAIDGAYSYPDTTVLTAPSAPCM
jgi:hypothetical protein